MFKFQNERFTIFGAGEGGRQNIYDYFFGIIHAAHFWIFLCVVCSNFKMKDLQFLEQVKGDGKTSMIICLVSPMRLTFGFSLCSMFKFQNERFTILEQVKGDGKTSVIIFWYHPCGSLFDFFFV